MVEMKRNKAYEGNWHHKLAEMLQNRELNWASPPHTTRKGAMPFLSVKEMGRLDCSVTNRHERPHLVKAHKDLAMLAFNQHVYTNEEDHRALRWVQKRGINLRGFRFKLKDSYWRTWRELGVVLIKLMNKYSRLHDMEITKYYATRDNPRDRPATPAGRPADLGHPQNRHINSSLCSLSQHSSNLYNDLHKYSI